MASSTFKGVSGRLLNSTEREAISKLMKIHQPILREMEKWKVQREKLETSLLDQIDAVGKILKPYYNKSQHALAKMTRGSLSAARTPNKKTASKKKSHAKKYRAR